VSEKQNIEWKQSWRDEYLKTICAFANTEGGTLIIGKDDKGQTVELDSTKKLLEDIPSKIKSHLGIISSLNLRNDGDRSFIEIITHPYTNPISYRGKFYVRSGSTTHELNGAELTDFLLAKSGKTWDEIIVDNASITDIDPDSIQKLITDSNEKGRLPETDDLSDLEIMQKLRVAQDDQIKRSGIILFAKDPNQFVPNCKVMIGRFGEDSEDLKFQEVVEGNLIYTLQEVQTQLNHKFLTRPVDFVGMMRQEKDEYPVAALREMLLNALVHKKYGGATIQLRVFDDRLSIWNEGVLPSGLTIESLKIEHNSKPPNPLIADVCFKAGYIDTWGRGTLKIYKACKEAGLPDPEIVEKDGGIEVTLIKAKVANPLKNEFGRNSEEIRNDFGTISEEIRKKFGANIQATFEEILKNPEYTAEQLANIKGVTSRTIENHQAKLKEGGYIERIGDNIGGYWKIYKSKRL
jgi:ATP-dependent DNA helicase RecG